MLTEVLPHPDNVQEEPETKLVVASDIGCIYVVYSIGVDRISKPMSLTNDIVLKPL